MTPITPFERRMRLVFGLAFAVLFSTIAVSVFVIGRLKTSSDWVSHTHQVITNINSIHIEFGNARVGTKNYLLTHEPRHLAPRISAFQKIDEGMIGLRVLTSDNADQQRNIEKANEAFREYYQLTAAIIQDVDVQHGITPEKFAEWTDKTEPAGRKVASALNKMKQEEERLLIIREQESLSFVNQAYGIMPFMLAIQVAITTYIYYGVLNHANLPKRFDNDPK